MFQNKSKNKKVYIFIAIAFIVLYALNKVNFEFLKSNDNQAKTTSVNSENSTEIISEKREGAYYLPTSTTNDVIIHNTYFLSYSEKHEQAEWVAYELKKEDFDGQKHKRPYFNQDPKVKTKSAHWNNYKNSGYTRGHLLPAGDRTFSKEAYDETFYTSNISPQLYEFNTGIWNSLEMRIRNFVRKNGKVYVVTGGILADNLKTIGNEKVAVPDYFYKVLLYKDEKQYKMLAYLIPHKEETRKSLNEYVVTTDSIETLTGIDFYHFLEDEMENDLESKIDINWFTR